MNTEEINKVRKDLMSFYKEKGYKKSVKPYQKKAFELAQLADKDLETWYINNGKQSFISIVFNELTERRDDTKYKRLCEKNNLGEELTEKEMEFAEEYESYHKIEFSII